MGGLTPVLSEPRAIRAIIHDKQLVYDVLLMGKDGGYL